MSMIDEDCSVQATRNAFCAAIATRRLDVRRLIRFDFDDGACIAGQAGMAWIAILA
jgi:hypothetical protein